MNLNLSISLGFISAQIALSPEAAAATSAIQAQLDSWVKIHESQSVQLMATSSKWSAL